jgi:integrase
LHLHHLRHFTAAQLVTAEIDICTAAGRVGHADTSVTLKALSHVLEAKTQEATFIMGVLLAPPVKFTAERVDSGTPLSSWWN